MNILVVDDDNVMRRLLRKGAMALGHESTGCTDAEKALEAFSSGDYDLILMDWMLPGMDGIELCKKIRQLPKGKDCFIIMVTAKDSYEDIIKVLDAGANDYIAKPVDMKILKTRIIVAERLMKRKS